MIRPAFPPRFLNPLILLLTLALSSCGGGTNTAGSGGSGIGGTGITTVTGNVSQVIAEGPEEEEEMQDASLARRMVAGAMSWVSAPVNADEVPLGDITVFGGGGRTTTDDSGNFVLEDVAPSANFILQFVVEDRKPVVLPIGTVPAGKRAQVNNIVVDVDQGLATAENVVIEENDAPGDESNGAAGNPGNAQNASNNNNAQNASANSNANSNGQANIASSNNQADGASNGANSKSDK